MNAPRPLTDEWIHFDSWLSQFGRSRQTGARWLQQLPWLKAEVKNLLGRRYISAAGARRFTELAAAGELARNNPLPEHPRWSPRHFALQKRAHKEFNAALKEGRLTRQPCVICGDPRSQGHHPDYRKPLEVQWLCQRHHMHVHAALNRRAIRSAQDVPQLLLEI